LEAASFDDWEDAAATLPPPGTEFLGFHLDEELGRGTFGRVYLARQGELAGRHVALKVACDIVGESQTLAQLQHTNIVPIYSFHRLGPFQAVCMPYFGRTTLADVVRGISGRASLPGSGRELRSTVTHHSTGAFDWKCPTKRGPGEPVSGTVKVIASQATSATSEVDGWSRLEGLSYVGA